jgi:glycosyltransferase involved in cell wall biosynthesis
MIVKNEEKHLKDCLLSVKDVIEEIVIVDTGSTDRTKEIAKEFGAKVYNFKWINDFSAARNFALEKSTGNWVLYLDADERLQESSKKELKELTQTAKKKAYFCCVNSIDEFNNRPSKMDYVRLFPKDELIRFEGKIHEQIEQSLIKENYTIEKSAIEILHVGYNVPDDLLNEKAERNLKLLLEEYKKNPTSYFAFQLGQTYGKLNNKYDAEKYFSIALKDPLLKKEYLSVANRYIAVISAERCEWSNALYYINESLIADATQPVALLVACGIYNHIGKTAEALKFCKDAFQMNEEYCSGERSSHQAILLDRSTIVDEGINLSAKMSDKESFYFFYDKIAREKIDTIDGSLALKLKLLDNLFENKIILEDEILNYVQLLKSENDVITILGLTDHYFNLKVKLNLLGLLRRKFPENSRLLTKLALCHEQNNDLLVAEELLEKSFSINTSEPSVIFYLASVYIKNKHFEKVGLLITSAEEIHRKEPQILKKLQILKNKLVQFIN